MCRHKQKHTRTRRTFVYQTLSVVFCFPLCSVLCLCSVRFIRFDVHGFLSCCLCFEPCFNVTHTDAGPHQNIGVLDSSIDLWDENEERINTIRPTCNRRRQYITSYVHFIRQIYKNTRPNQNETPNRLFFCFIFVIIVVAVVVGVRCLVSIWKHKRVLCVLCTHEMAYKPSHQTKNKTKEIYWRREEKRMREKSAK